MRLRVLAAAPPLTTALLALYGCVAARFLVDFTARALRAFEHELAELERRRWPGA